MPDHMIQEEAAKLDSANASGRNLYCIGGRHSNFPEGFATIVAALRDPSLVSVLL